MFQEAEPPDYVQSWVARDDRLHVLIASAVRIVSAMHSLRDCVCTTAGQQSRRQRQREDGEQTLTRV